MLRCTWPPSTLQAEGGKGIVPGLCHSWKKNQDEKSTASQAALHKIQQRGRGDDRGKTSTQASIPIPREATSVATMMGLFPVLNSFKTQSRSFCCLSPWIAVDISLGHISNEKVVTHIVLASRLDEGI